jgi:glucose dehydrogenase
MGNEAPPVATPAIHVPRRDAPRVCVIGSGVAGALTAWKLGRAGVRTMVLEAGPRFPREGAAERMARFLDGDYPWQSDWPERDAFTSAGEVDYPLNDHRVRGVGGTTLHWQAYSPRFLENDFRMGSRYGLASDWPISYTELEPYYGEAEVELGVACEQDNPFAAPRSRPFPLPGFPWSYDERILVGAGQRLGLVFHSLPQARTSEPYRGRPGCETYGVCRVCPIRARYGADTHVELAEATGHVEVVSGACVVRLEARGERVGRAIYRTRDGSEHAVEAEAFVLAAHAVESARLLLLSAQPGHPDGLANASGAVGRYFMEHMGQFRFARLGKRLHPGRTGFQTTISQQFHDRPDRDRASGFLLRGYAEAGGGRGLSSMIGEMALRSGNWGEGFAREVEDRVDAEYGRHMLLGSNAEALPSEANRIELDPDRFDAFGDPVPRVHYGISDYERRGYEDGDRWIHDLADALDAESLGPLQNHFSSHHAGTCRMGADPETSVVDSNLKAHEITNLYVVGSANFVTHSVVNPTLTIAALALRLGDHLTGLAT